MENISPIFKKIAETPVTNQNNLNNIAYYKSSEQNQDSVELSEKKPKKKGLGKILLIGAGIAATITTIYMAAKGKIKLPFKSSKAIEKEADKVVSGIKDVVNKDTNIVENISKPVEQKAQNLAANVKNFIGKDGAAIKDIKLVNGKAVGKDGSAFSGIMETLTKSGQKVSIEYQNGLMTNSKINDKLFKTFEAYGCLPRTSGTQITKYGENENILSTVVHLYLCNGKVKRIYSGGYFPDWSTRMISYYYDKKSYKGYIWT